LNEVSQFCSRSSAPMSTELTRRFLIGIYSSAIQGDTELSRLLKEFGKKGDDEDTDSDTANEDNSGSGSGEETLADVQEDESKLEAEDLAIKLKMQQSAALMRQAQLVPVQEQKLETLKNLKRSTRPKEKREQGSVKWSIYKGYVEANGYLGVRSVHSLDLLSLGLTRFGASSQVFLYLFTILLQQGLNIAKDVWLKQWAQHNAATGDNGNLWFYLGIYATIGTSASLAMFVNGVLLYSLCVIRAAKKMHDRM